MATTSATRKSLVMVGDGDDDDDVRTPVRVGHGGIGTLRSTHMMEDAETRAARQRETTTTTTTMTVRRASMTPPQALRMSLMSPKPPTTVRVASSSTMDVDARALVVGVETGMLARALTTDDGARCDCSYAWRGHDVRYERAGRADSAKHVVLLPGFGVGSFHYDAQLARGALGDDACVCKLRCTNV